MVDKTYTLTRTVFWTGAHKTRTKGNVLLFARLRLFLPKIPISVISLVNNCFYFQKKEKMPDGPFVASTLQALIHGFDKDSLNREEMLKCLIGSVSPDDSLDLESVSRDPLKEEDEYEPLEASHPHETNREMERLNVDAMFENATDDEGVRVSDNSEEEDTSILSTEVLQPSTLIFQPKVQEVTLAVQKEAEKKRKLCTCNHEDLFGESYFPLTVRSFFYPNYMNEREHPVHYCTGIKENGEKCGLDFANPDFTITVKNPVMACKQALMLETDCVHALCKGCFEKAKNNQLSQCLGRSKRIRHNTAATEDASGIVGV